MKNNGLLKYIVQITCILALSYTAQVSSLNIDIKQLFGTWQCLKDDKKYLSPLNGAICAETGWIENMYRFGEVDTEVVLKDGRQVFKKREESKRRIKQNATSELVFLLFNAFPNIDGIHVSKSPASPAAALTPVLIGQLLNELEKLIGTQCHILFDLSDDEDFNKIIKNIKTNFRNPADDDKKYIALKRELTELEKQLKSAENKDNIINKIAIVKTEINTIKNSYEQIASEKFATLLNNYSEKLLQKINIHFDICDKRVKIIILSPNSSEAIKAIQKLLKINKISDAENFLQLILKSLLECGLLKLQPLDIALQKGPLSIGSNKYNIIVSEKDLPKDKLPVLQELQFLPYTTHNVLLSLLAMKLNIQDDLKAYFDSFTPSIMKDKWQEQCKPHIENDIKQFEVIRASTNYEKSLEDACKGKTLQDCYELIACTEIEMLNPRQAPKRFIYGTSTIKIDGKTYSFSDCTETALLNFICLVLTKLDLYDWEKKSFLLNDNERVKKAISWLITQESHVKKTEQKPTQEEINQRIKNFLPDGFFEFFANVSWKDPFEAHNLWTQLISNKNDKGFEYLNNNIYELKPAPKNFVEAFKYLCGCSCDTFDQICSMLEIYDSKNKNTFSLGEFEKNKKYTGTATWRISKDFEPSIDITFNLSFKPGHAVFALSRNESDATPFIESIFKESTTNQLIMLLTYLYAYRNLKLDKRLELIDFSAKPSERKLAIFRNMLYGYDFAKTRTRRMNLIEWLYKTKEKISNKEILTAKLDEYKDSDGDTLLNCAIAWDEDKVAKLLIEHGATINQKNNDGNTPLHRAALQGKSDIVELLIKKGANTNEQNENGNTPLHAAIIQEQPEIAKILIEQLIKDKADLNIQNSDGETPLHNAISWRQSDIAKILIEQLIKDKADLNLQNKDENTPLHLAVNNKLPEIAKILIDQLIKDKADLNIQNSDGNTPLHTAIIKGQSEIAKILIEQLIKDKAKLNLQNKDENTPLHLAVKYKLPDIAEILIDQLIKDKVSLNLQNKYGDTPLHLAVNNKLPDIAEILIDQLIKDKASLNLQNKYGDTPLHLALMNDQPEIAKILIDQLSKNKANLNQKGYYDYTPLHLAIIAKFSDIAKILIDQLIKDKANLNIKNSDGDTPLLTSLFEGKLEIAKLLIEQLINTKANLNIQNKRLFTPLHAAINNRQLDIAKILIEQLIKDKANLNQKSINDYTPLHIAITAKFSDIAKILIDQLIKDKADLNIQSSDGDTPLHVAFIESQPEIAKILIKQLIKDKADLNLQNKDGLTPLNLAIIRKFPDIAKILIDQLIKDKADLNIQDSDGDTPLDLARKKGYNDIVKLLKKGMKQTK